MPMNKQTHPPTLKTKRLVLKPFGREHQQYLFEIFDDEKTMKFYNMGPVKTSEKP